MLATEMPSTPIWQPREGETFVTQGRTVTEADVVSFSTLVGDMHPVHLDAEWAAETPFGERVAPGALVLSYALGLVHFDPRCAVALRGIDGVLFTRPVRIGDTLTVSGRVTSISPGGEGASVLAITLRTENQHRKTVCRARLQLIWRDAAGDRGAGDRPSG